MLEKNCDRFEKCMGQKLKYHCVMFEGKLVEVCAPRSSIRGTGLNVILKNKFWKRPFKQY